MERVQIRDGDPGNDKVPEAYTPKPDAPLAISELRCKVAKLPEDEEPLPSPVSLAFAVIELQRAPTGSYDNLLIGDNYLLFVSTNSKSLADWLRAGTGIEAYHVPDLAYNYAVPAELFGEATFDFKAPGPRSWAFTVAGNTRAQRRAPLPIGEGWAWQDTKTPDGRTWRARLESEAHDNYAIFPVDMTVRPKAGSELDKMLVPEEGWSDDGPSAKDPFAASGFIPDWDVVKTRTIIEP